MPKPEFNKFHDKFWANYNKKNYKEVIEDIPKLLEFECDSHIELPYRQMCCYSILAFKCNKTVNIQQVKNICVKFQILIRSSPSVTTALKYFICMEYVTYAGNLEAIDRTTIEKMISTVFNKMSNCQLPWTDSGLTLFNRFTIVLAELESMLSLSQGSALFTETAKALEYFPSAVSDGRKIVWPLYLLSTLKVLESYNAESTDSVKQLREKVRSLAKDGGKFRKDIAIMMSQIIHAGRSLISKSSVQFMEDVFAILGELYGIIRDKSVSSEQYMVKMSFAAPCCDHMNTHTGLHILETVRSISVEAIKDNNFSEVVVSTMSNFALAESAFIEHSTCKQRGITIHELSESVRTIVDQIDKIVVKCGFERAKRTLQKFLSTKSLHVTCYLNAASALRRICKESSDKTDEIDSCALQLMFGKQKRDNQIHYIFEIHNAQREQNDPEKFETISSIVKRLSALGIAPELNLTQLQFLQLTVEIDYPKLPELCLRKLIDDLCKMDYYKNEQCCYVNLHKSAISYLQCMVEIRRYKSNVQIKEYFQTLVKEFMSLKIEFEIVKNLKESLNYLAKFFHCKDVWMVKKDHTDYIPFAEKMLQQICEILISRHYKNVAITGFELFYKFAKLLEKPLKQIVAAGYLIENIHLVSTLSEVEIVTELQTTIMGKLRFVDKMSADELADFLLSFLQLTMYTMRYQHNIEHAKKYMQAINKLLKIYDSAGEKYLAARLKYAEVMFELIVKDPNAAITPITYIEEIFHCFQKINTVNISDHNTVPGIVFDLLNTLYAFTQPRYEFRYSQALIWVVHRSSLKKGYLFLFAKTTILESSECLLINGKNLESHLKHLDVIFGCETLAVPEQANVPKQATSWSKDITPLIHVVNCKCFQCVNKLLNLLNMEVAAVKAWAVYLNKDYLESLESFQRIYDHWKASNNSSYSVMLMNYSNCLNSNCREEESKCILNEALDACNDYAQAQDISLRLLYNEVETGIVHTQSYAEETRPKDDKSKKKINRKCGVLSAKKQPKAVSKKYNLRN